LKKIILFLLTVLNISFLYFAGCVPSKPTDEVEILPSERLINKLEVNRRRIRNFEGTGTLHVQADNINNNASFKVVLQKPDSIFLTIMGPFGIELAQALVTKEKFSFYDVLHNTIYQGSTNDEVLKDIFKINLSFNDLIDAFIGSVNLTENLYKPPASYEIDYDQYVLTYVDSLTGVETQYRVDVRELGIKNFKIIDGNDETILEGKYSDFEILETVAVPYKIEVMNKEKNQSVMIEYKRMDANKKNISINFEIPKDATVIKW